MSLFLLVQHSISSVRLHISYAILCCAAATFGHLLLCKLRQVFLARLVLLASMKLVIAFCCGKKLCLRTLLYLKFIFQTINVSRRSLGCNKVKALQHLPFPFGSLGRVALCSRGHRKRFYICVCSSHFATHNGYPLCYEMAHSSLRRKTQFVAKASSLEVNCPDYIIEGP